MRALLRFALNFVVYLVLGGGVLSFVGLRDSVNRAPPSFSVVIFAAFSVALWSGGLTTVNEVVVSRLVDTRGRVGLAGLLGALSLGGFAAVLSFVAWNGPSWDFILIGTALGGLMQAGRAFSHRPPLRDTPEEASPVA